MDVLHVVPVGGLSGAERHLLQLLTGLRARGTNAGIAYIPIGSVSPFVDTLRREHIPFWELPQRRTPLSTFVHLHKLLRDLRPKVIHSHLTRGHILGQLGAAAHSTPSVLSLHSAHPLFGSLIRKAPTVLSMHLSDHIICNSHYVARVIAETSSTLAEKTSVVHYGIDASRWESPRSRMDPESSDRRPSGSLTLTMTSRLIPGKGHLFALEAFELVRHQLPHLRLKIVGSGPLESRVAHEVRSRDLEGVELVGRVDDVLTVLAETDIFLMPTAPALGEGFGLALLEAMACSVPAIATRCGSLPELVVPGETGCLVDFGDVQELTDAIQTLSTNPDLRRAMGRRSRERALETFGVHEMIARTKAVYRRV